MNSVVNSKRVFCVQPHRPIGFGEMLGKRGDIRLDMLEQKSPDEAALEILSAAHAYQISSARDELAPHYHARAELLGRTPNLLIVSTNGAGYDTVDVKACTERGVLVVNQSGGNAEAVAEHVLGMMLCLVKRVTETDRALRAGTLEEPQRLYRPRGLRQDHRHRRARQCRQARRRTCRHFVQDEGAGLRSLSQRRCGEGARRREGRARRAIEALRFRLDQLSADAGDRAS